MTHHLGYARHERAESKPEFETRLIAKHQRSSSGFDDKIIALYARGLSTREIQGHLKEICDVDVSPELISHVTDVVLDEVNDWQSRPLDTLYPILYLDALFVNIKEQGHVGKKAVYLIPIHAFPPRVPWALRFHPRVARGFSPRLNQYGQAILARRGFVGHGAGRPGNPGAPMD